MGAIRTTLTLMAIVGVTLAIAGGPQPASAAEPLGVGSDEAVYRARFAAMTSHGDYYTPQEPVPGAPGAKPLLTATSPEVAPSALAAARAYAEVNTSTAFLVWRDGAVEAAAYFRGVDAHTPLVSKSLSKPLTAIVIGRAIALGYIRSLDQPVSDFIPEWRGGSKAAIRVRNLLDMRSGLLGQGPASGPDDILNRAYLDPHHDRVLIEQYPLVGEPGTRFDYANAVADLVAIVIERATHQRYAAFVSQAVLQPLRAEGGTVWVDRAGGVAHSACCMMLPAETWLRLAILLIDDGRWDGQRLLPEGYVEQMRRPTPQNPFYGLGVYVSAPYARRRGLGDPDGRGPQVLQGEPYLAKDLYLFDGAGDQVVYLVPSRRMIVLRMGEAPPKSPEWDNAVLPNTLLRGLGPPPP